MANRYWVGGTGAWDGTALLKWSTTSGGIGGSAVPTSADTVFFDAASGANTVTIGSGTAICATLTMTGFTGTLAFGSNSITLASTGTIYTGDTTFSVSGTPLMLCTSSNTANRAVSCGAVTEANSISFNVTAGPNAFAISGSYKNLTFSGTFTGSLSNNVKTMYGNLTFKTGMTISAGASGLTFAATSGTQTITSAALNLDFPITFSGTATYQLQDDLSCGTATARTITLTSGTLDLNNNAIINVGSFVSSTTNTRAILFGSTGKYENTNTGTSTVWNMAVANNFTYTGTSSVVLSGNAASGITRSIQHGSTSGGTEANAISFTVSGGQSGSIFANTGTTNSSIKNLVFTTGFAGALSNSNRTIYGNFTCSSTMSLTAGTLTTTFSATSGTQQITSAALTVDFPITINAPGATVQLIDALTMGSTRRLTLTNGTFNSNAKNVTCGDFNYNNTNTKTLTLANSTVTILGGSSTLGYVGSNTGTTHNLTNLTLIFTTTGTALANFSGTIPTLTISGVGSNIIIGGAATASYTITTLNNTVSPCTVSLGSTITRVNVTNFNLSGTAGNLVTLNSTVAGTQVNIRKTIGTVSAQYMYIQDSLADGGATWNAQFSTNAGNNTGWNFSSLFTGDVSEAFSIFDLISNVASFNSDITEPITLADTPDTTAAFISDTTEPITLADTPTGLATYAFDVVEAITVVTDIESLIATFSAAISEALAIADLATIQAAFTSAITEATTLADTQTVLAAFNSAITEITTLADTPSATATFATVITENASFADVTSSLAAFAAAITEAATLADSPSVVLTINTAISEALTLDNSQTVVANFASLVLEGITTADSQTAAATFRVVVSENTNIQDLESVLASFVSSLSEAIRTADSSLAVRIHNSAATEALTIADAQTALRIQNALIAENINPADAITVIASFTSQITENLVLLDDPFPRGWFKINDSQTAVWTAVNNAGSSTWNSVNDDQSVTWTPINNNYP
jgi:hypothetical protein